MAMAASEIEALIKAALPDARVTVEDLAGDGDHYAATVVSEQFRGIPRVKQHQIVYAALRGRMGGELHALALQTSAPDDPVPPPRPDSRVPTDDQPRRSSASRATSPRTR